MHCQLCQADGPDIARIAGIEFCFTCRSVDVRRLLTERGIVCEWQVLFGWLIATITLPPQPHPFALKCGRQGLHNAWLKLFVHEVEVGDPIFDDRVFVRTSDRERAAAVLANEGVQSAVLGLLSRTFRHTRGPPPYVSLNGNVISARVQVSDSLGLPPTRDAQVELMALALHLTAESDSATR